MAKGFKTLQVCRIVGLSPRQVDYWDWTGFISPSVAPARGRGSSRLYSFADLLCFRTARLLMGAGISVQKIRKCIQYLKTHCPEVDNPLAQCVFLTDGKSIFKLTDKPDVILDTLHSGQLVLKIAVGDLAGDLTRRIERAERRQTKARRQA
ncbi:MAG: MerR family transcriptional regulator [Acidobacteria bacterium]|nr:MerR family transcriptional regulator [Acidobacteriota bacterium]